MAKPKLALIPATQGSKLYSVLPADGVGDFTFSRGSSATRINKDGLIETVASGVSRLNYPLIDGVVNGCPSHLLEPSRTNSLPYSEDFSQWIGSSYITSNYAISPDGTLNASRLLFTGAGQEIKYNLTTSSSTSGSIYVKGISGKTIRFGLAGSENNFTLNGNWQKLEIQGTETSNKITLNTYGSVTARDLSIYGAQLEQGSFPTSYIKSNSGTTTTRSAETANGSGNASTFNDSEGVLMAEISALDSSDTSSRRLGITKDGTYEGLRLQLGSGNISVTVYDGTTNQYNQTVNIDNSIFHKVALKYKTNDFALWIDGIEYFPQSSGSTFVNGTLDDISFDYVGGNPFRGSTKQIQYFDSALNDSDLETLTSWTSFTDMANGQLYSIK